MAGCKKLSVSFLDLVTLTYHMNSYLRLIAKPEIASRLENCSLNTITNQKSQTKLKMRVFKKVLCKFSEKQLKVENISWELMCLKVWERKETIVVAKFLI